MVIRPLPLPPYDAAGCAAAWPVIEASQRAASNSCRLIAQNDHAILSGEIAAAFGAAWAPRTAADVVEAIALHDSGWTAIEAALGARAAAAGQRPPSFIAVPVPDFLRAWTGSIENAARRSAVAGILVSLHFASIGRMRMRAAQDPPEICAQLAAFDEHEVTRRAALFPAQPYSQDQLTEWLDLLQFCDLVSLYMCAGAQAQVELPQRFSGRAVRLCGHTAECVLNPSPLARPVRFAVTAPAWPEDNGRSDMYLTLR